MCSLPMYTIYVRCSCIETGDSVPIEEVRAAIAQGKEGEEGWLAMAERHGGLVKPDIVFFGEPVITM